MRVGITGASGQLGWEICRQIGPQAIRLTRKELDFSEPEQIQWRLQRFCPEVLINCAAFTQVDQAEKDPIACRTINATAVGYLADYCRQESCKLVQISTDYVFDGCGKLGGFTEEDPPGPQSVYATSKWEGEMAAAKLAGSLIVRTCGLYGHAPGRSHFLGTILRIARERGHLNVVDDQRCTPTYVPHLAGAILKLLELDAHTTFHVVNQGSCTWREFAVEILRLAGLSDSVDLRPISTKDFGALALRPANSVLNTARYAMTVGTPLPTWQAALVEYFTQDDR